MRKLCARWVLRVLTDQKKLERADVSQYNLNMFKRNPKEFLRRFVIIDETWIHQYTPKTKEQLKQWAEAGLSAPKPPKTQQSAGKVSETMIKLTELEFECSSPSPVFSIFAPLRLLPVSKLMRSRDGKRFYSSEEVIAEINAYFEELSTEFYKKGIVFLETR